MRNLLFLASMVGVLLIIDAVKFAGSYRQDVWQQATNIGQAFSRELEYRLHRTLW